LYAIVDIETTGNNYKGQKITEISIFLYDGNKVIDEFTSLVNPEQHIPPFITNLTGITDAMVRHAPKFYEIAKKVHTITENAVFVAHNVNFDYNIIKSEFQSLGFEFNRKKLCTVRLSRKIIPGHRSYSLGNLCAALNIPLYDRHRAKGDVEATVKLFQLLQEKDQQFVINSFLNPRSKQATLPPLLKKEVVDSLPETFGVYYFRNEKKEIIYVGKANNIKQRVISHFYDKKRKEIAMCLEIAHIDYAETGSELLALLLESAEIKKIFPKYNAAQKRRVNAFGIFTYLDQKGIRHIAYNSAKALLNPLVTFDNMTACRVFIENLCSAYELCPKYCHLQENVKQCFHHQIKECRGICCGKEAIESYNKRVALALKEMQLQNADLIIKETGRTQDEVGFALILKGGYKGFGYLPKEVSEQLDSPEDYQFYLQPQQDNSDVQRILRSYLRKKEGAEISLKK
tara:strand:+ start:81640 stop:83013 length:1374 start_codon:yes stop_codon:yes gene_type:complete